MRHHTIKALTVAVAMLGSSSAIASDPDSVGFFGSSIGGAADVSSMVYGQFGNSKADTYTGDASEFTKGSGGNDETDHAVGVGAAFEVRNASGYGVGAEAGYIDFGKSRWNGLWNGAPSTGTVERDGWKLGLTGSAPVANNVRVTGRVGQLWWDSEEREVGATPISESGNDTYYGVGVQTQLTDTVGLGAEVERYKDVDGDDIDVYALRLIWGLN